MCDLWVGRNCHNLCSYQNWLLWVSKHLLNQAYEGNFIIFIGNVCNFAFEYQCIYWHCCASHVTWFYSCECINIFALIWSFVILYCYTNLLVLVFLLLKVWSLIHFFWWNIRTTAVFIIFVLLYSTVLDSSKYVFLINLSSCISLWVRFVHNSFWFPLNVRSWFLWIMFSLLS